MRSLVAAVGVTLILSVTAGSALAASPRNTQYDNPGQQEPVTVVKTEVLATRPTTSKGPSSQPASTGTLPFTGLDLALIVGLGGALVGGGLALRAAGRKRNETS